MKRRLVNDTQPPLQAAAATSMPAWLGRGKDSSCWLHRKVKELRPANGQLAAHLGGGALVGAIFQQVLHDVNVVLLSSHVQRGEAILRTRDKKDALSHLFVTLEPGRGTHTARRGQGSGVAKPRPCSAPKHVFTPVKPDTCG